MNVRIAILCMLVGTLVTGCELSNADQGATGTGEVTSASQGQTGPVAGVAGSADAMVSGRADAVTAGNADAVAGEALQQVGVLLNGDTTGRSYRLAEPLALRNVRMDALQAFQGGVDPESLVLESHDRIYPVLQGEKVVASITLHQTDAGWAPSVIGEGSASGDLLDARTLLRSEHPVDGGVVDLVFVQGANARFLAYHAHGALLLASLRTVNDLTPRPARDVFGELSIAAARR